MPDSETLILEDSYRSLGDAEAFDEMLAHWAERLDAQPDAAPGDFETPRMSKHLAILTPLLEQFSDAISPDSFKQHIANSRGPAVLATAEGSIVYSNPKAQASWNLWTGMRGNFDFFADESNEDWEALKRSAAGNGNRIFGILKTGHDTDGLCVVSVIKPSTGIGRLLKIEQLLHEWPEGIENLLHRTFSLTESETEICKMLLFRPGLGDIAQDRGSSVGTVKKQLRSIFAKCDLSSQSELIRLLSSLCAKLVPAAPEIVMSWKDPLGREEVFEDNSGQQIAYSRMGAKDGEPVVLIHGPLTGNLLPLQCDAILAKRDISLYTLSRPGFGNSIASTNDCAVEAGSDAIGSFVDYMGWDKCALAGLVGGFIPAVHYAAHNSSRVTHLISIGSCFPISDRKDRAHLPYHHRVFLDIVRFAPKVSEFLVRHAHRGAKYGGAEFILRRVYRDSEIDLRTLFAPENLPYSFAAVSLLMATGYDAFLKDQSLLSYPWDDLLSTLNIPMTTLAGEFDPIFPLGMQQRSAQKHQNWQTVIAEGAGQTVYLSHPNMVCDILAGEY